MAGAAYTALVGARLDQKRISLQQDIASYMARQPSIALPVGFATGFNNKLVQEAREIAAKIGRETKITYSWGISKESGSQVITQAVAEFKNELGTAMQSVVVPGFSGALAKGGARGVISENFGSLNKQNLAVENQLAAVEARRVDLNTKLAQKAEVFLAKTEGATGAASEQARAVAVQIQETEKARAAAVAQFGRGAPQVTALDRQMDSLNQRFSVAQARLNQTQGAFRSWTNSLGNAIKQTISYSISVGALYGALAQLQTGITYITELNKEMTNIQVLQVEGGKTGEDISKLATGFNNLAREMGATTLETAKGSLEWLRQGKTVSETQELLRSTLMLSKLGALSTAEATDFLTSTLNSFSMGAEEAVGVVDKLIAVD